MSQYAGFLPVIHPGLILTESQVKSCPICKTTDRKKETCWVLSFPVNLGFSPSFFPVQSFFSYGNQS